MSTFSFERLTVGQFQELYKINRSESSEYEKAISFVSLITGQPRWEVEQMSLRDFKAISKGVLSLFSELPEMPKLNRYIKLGKRWFEIILDPRKLTAGQYMDIQHFLGQKTPVELVMHQIVATLLIPVKRFGPFIRRGKYNGETHADISELVQGLKIMEVNSICVFFLRLWNASIMAMVPYLEKELSTMNPKNQEKIDLQMLRDIISGYTMPNEWLTSKT